MEAPMSTQEQQLCEFLMGLAAKYSCRYNEQAERDLLQSLFWCMAGGNAQYMDRFFPITGGPLRGGTLKLREAQGAVNGAEYTEAARGHACGHIFRPGEATYSCKTCGTDDTCCLCSRCFESTDHRGHMVRISVSPGNSGCCDCGDSEAWRTPMYCTIHSAWQDGFGGKNKGKAPVGTPRDLEESIRMTISRVFDFMCDVVSCSPEQLRQTKTVQSIQHDERMSRLSATYGGGDTGPPDEYAVLLWNDEKHTVTDVAHQVARACQTTAADGQKRAHETDEIGRSLLKHSQSIESLLRVSRILEDIKVTVTIRSSRDTFREQMCGSIIEWLSDITGCSVGDDHGILRRVVCEELLRPWRKGSPASHAIVGQNGIDDEDTLSQDGEAVNPVFAHEMLLRNRRAAQMAAMMQFRATPRQQPHENRTAVRNIRERDVTPSDSDTAEPLIAASTYAKIGLDIPKTPGGGVTEKAPPPKPGHYWLGVPAAYMECEGVQPAEDLFQRVRLDWLILFDLRMWKKVRNDLRSLYISTVVTIPEFKRVLGLRFAGLYTTLAQLYLIGDREPDHSIINISLQMLTTPSITAEIVERGNFLTSLMAILYTFLTTRQVGHPWDVSSSAVLAFDSGSVTNRRMYHFFVDLKFLFSSPHVQERLRTEDRYMMQFLDLVKLHQGICPNTRAIGEHVEYETDTWISASLITREINRLCRQFSEAFRNLRSADYVHLHRAIRVATKSVIINSIGAERLRFSQAEIRDEVVFKTVTDLEFDEVDARYDVVAFVVERQPISFHHALHYTLSWLIECGRSMSVETLRALLSFTAAELKGTPRSMGRKIMPRRDYEAEDYLMAAFDYSLRVCAWLAQMKAGMWVRNGISLRHQAGTYRGVSQRDVAHHRDVFLLQTALVVCNPSRVLASVIDRFGMERWVKGIFEQKTEAQDDGQHLDVVEDMVHLLIVLVSDRTSLVEAADGDGETEAEAEAEAAQILALRRDIIHVLCFRPLSYSDICNKLPDRYQEQENFQKVLESLTVFKAPDGNADVGTFELEARHIEEVDPYIAHYSKNQREESETAYRRWMAKKTGRPVESIVYEPRLRPIRSGAFVGLSNFTSTGIFAQLVYYSLLYSLTAGQLTPAVPITRVETFLQVLLHLVLIAIAEDKTGEGEGEEEKGASFIELALNKVARSNFMASAPAAKTIVALLDLMSTREELKSCQPKITLILKRMRQKRPQGFAAAYARLGVSVERISTASPANNQDAEEERERKKRAALARQARVMAQFQEQQKSFLEKQGDVDWGTVDEELDEELDQTSSQLPTEKKAWKYPGGTCILCQENTDERRLYGTFAFFTDSMILRQTDLQDADFVREAASTPRNLDRSAEKLRPFGVAGENRSTVVKISAEGKAFETERQGIGKGFPAQNCHGGTLSVGCGHIMHYHCFEAYFEATLRRHHQQIARHHPEDTEKLEFVCPLCKALGNAFLPIVWKGKEESYPGALEATQPFGDFLDGQMTGTRQVADGILKQFARYMTTATIGSVQERTASLVSEAWEPTMRPSSALSAVLLTSPVTVASLLPMHSHGHGFGQRAALSGGGGGGGNIVHELVGVYRRLCMTLWTNELRSQFRAEGEMLEGELCMSDTLAQAVGYSISAVEIQQRGTDAEYGMTLLSKIPEQQMTHLRVLCETVTSYIAVGAHRRAGNNRVEGEFRRDSERQHCQLFAAQYANEDEETESTDLRLDRYAPLLSLDPFVFLCECVFGVMPAQQLQMAHLVRLCYLAELVKAVYHMGRNFSSAAWVQLVEAQQAAETTEPIRGFAEFCLGVMRLTVGADGTMPANGTNPVDALRNRAFDQDGLHTVEGYYNFTKRYALVFLRKTAVLLHAQAGVDFNSHVSPAPELDELDRLSEALRLPSFDDMCTAPTAGGAAHGWPATTTRLVAGWLQHSVRALDRAPTSSANPSALLSHPAIYELVGLPRHFDQLLDACTRCRCPTTGKDVSDPMICLLCGTVFCGQAICCLKEEKGGRRQAWRKIGGAQQHMRKCQGNIGLFLSIRKCCIFYLHRLSGSYGYAPYIDKYGEVDLGFRHGRPLLLNQRRYDLMLRAVWLSHGIPSFISRKLEMDINNGGWETV
ncbi:ubiquitin-protein ligase e3 component [Grosmannia clavigera kw1407]|uniref:E3 ubiquitin-protein ligase n=1 Tax=Grosmannia clavigera (strain kw1407 / UAMH 11150) TaxID=655863 RepID=F0XEZ6_GROCL|nr:ubiquitin-protein ligase e3 component [Grosmannia clavigera kw1407]EFX03776.1 ubiquitin-protein ligase e3 component [Grosmannia clavigera kw1407]